MRDRYYFPPSLTSGNVLRKEYTTSINKSSIGQFNNKWLSLRIYAVLILLCPVEEIRSKIMYSLLFSVLFSRL